AAQGWTGADDIRVGLVTGLLAFRVPEDLDRAISGTASPQAQPAAVHDVQIAGAVLDNATDQPAALRLRFLLLIAGSTSARWTAAISGRIRASPRPELPCRHYRLLFAPRDFNTLFAQNDSDRKTKTKDVSENVLEILFLGAR